MRGAALITSVIGAAVLSGCIDRDAREQMSAGDSVLAPLFKTTTVKEAAAWAADPFDADKRARGTLLLANAPFGGEEAYVELYRKHAADSNTNVQSVAARALGMHGAPDDVSLLIPLANSQDRNVRLEAVRSMQRLHNSSAIPVLLERINPSKETEPDIRAEAASALGQYADLKGLTGLIAALGDSSLLVNVKAHDSLKTLTGQDLPSERRTWAKWQKETPAPFAGRQAYVYPVFWRERRWLDYVPIIGGPPPNETASTPSGFPDLGSASEPTAQAPEKKGS